LARRAVGIEYRFERIGLCARGIRKHGLDESRNRSKCDPPFEKRLDGDFVGRVQHRRHGASLLERCLCQAQARKPADVRRMEIEATHARQIERRDNQSWWRLVRLYDRLVKR